MNYKLEAAVFGDPGDPMLEDKKVRLYVRKHTNTPTHGGSVQIKQKKRVSFRNGSLLCFVE